jgi:uncharacterized protein with HEPN domain
VKDDRLYLIHITECIGRIEEYTAEGKDAFFADRKTPLCVIFSPSPNRRGACPVLSS